MAPDGSSWEICVGVRVGPPRSLVAAYLGAAAALDWRYDMCEGEFSQGDMEGFSAAGPEGGEESAAALLGEGLSAAAQGVGEAAVEVGEGLLRGATALAQGFLGGGADIVGSIDQALFSDDVQANDRSDVDTTEAIQLPAQSDMDDLLVSSPPVEAPVAMDFDQSAPADEQNSEVPAEPPVDNSAAIAELQNAEMEKDKDAQLMSDLSRMRHDSAMNTIGNIR